MTIKIKATKIGISKPIEIKPTINRQDEANEMLIKLLQQDDANETVDETEDVSEQIIKSIQGEREFVNEAFDFLKSILGITDTQVKKARSLIGFVELGEYLSYVIGRIKGRSDADFELDKKVEEAKDSDPKDEESSAEK